MSRTTYHELIKNKVYIGGVDAIETADENENIDVFFDLRASIDELAHQKSIHTPLLDDAEIETLQQTLQQVNEAIDNNQKVYFHCNTGRGRTGALATLLLYELNPELTMADAEALAITAREDIKLRENFKAALLEIEKQSQQ